MVKKKSNKLRMNREQKSIQIYRDHIIIKVSDFKVKKINIVRERKVTYNRDIRMLADFSTETL